MKINGTIFSKPQQDQLKRAIENSGGTTLNKYNYTILSFSNNTENLHLIRILTEAKGRIYGSASYQVEYYINNSYANIITTDIAANSKQITIKIYEFSMSSGKFTSGRQMIQNMDTGIYSIDTVSARDGIIQITYLNDTEIT